MRINEVNMAPAKLKKEALKTTVKVGIEFELITSGLDVPTETDYESADAEIEVNYAAYERDTNRDGDSMEKILENYTEGFSRVKILSIVSDFESWLEDKHEEIFNKTISDAEDFVYYAIKHNHYSIGDSFISSSDS